MPAPDSLRFVIVLPASAERLYRAWLDGTEHAAFTGSAATGSAKVSAKHTAWDGYISGKNLELEPNARIVQSWRTTEFAEDVPDSRVELTFTPASGGTRLTLVHDGIPAGMRETLRAGWQRHYLEPMKAYFRADGVSVRSPAPERPTDPAETLGHAHGHAQPAPAVAAKPRKSRRT